ncbi:MAG TPA: dicarboxylate/amino acid:cation symporter [Longimicrobium sp.]|jgi:DAACS family dicarboxylate/amino acid:cation (Na+ or H+) symporter
MTHDTAAPRGMQLHTRILLGLAVGTAAGITANALWRDSERLDSVITNVTDPVGQVFLRMLFMVVVPLVFTSLALGVAQLGDLTKVGRIGGKTIGFFLVTTAFAAIVGLFLVNTIQPGNGLDPGVRDALMQQFGGQAAEKKATAETNGFGIQTLVNIVPRNPVDAAAKGEMLPLIFFALIFGVALTRIPAEAARPVLKLLEGISYAVTVIIGFAMKIAPFGVAALIFGVTARFGFALLQSLGMYVVVVLGGLAFHLFIVIPALSGALAGVGPLDFLRRSRTLMVTAFSTSSSNATLPTTIRTAQQEFGVPREIAGFVMPLGATMNMNGTALFEGITILFLAQVFGVTLGLQQQLVVVVMCIITAIGAAGVPGGSIPLLVLVLEMVGVPGGGIALILGVDRILDMSRTVPNVCGDLLTSLVVARSEGATLPQPFDADPTVMEPGEPPVGAEPVPLQHDSHRDTEAQR